MKGWKLQDTFILRLRTSCRVKVYVYTRRANKESMPRKNNVLGG